MAAAAATSRLAYHDGAFAAGSRTLPEEAPVALVYDGATQAVMLATPADLTDFAVGFSLTEGIIAQPSDIRSVEIAGAPLGVEVRIWLASEPGAALAARRRYIAGPTGCGLCGIDSLAEAAHPPRRVTDAGEATPADIAAALDALTAAQTLGRATRAVHAAGFWTRERGLVAAREDVGRHNALDKLAGTLARSAIDASTGLVVITSRVSVEMVQKTAAIGAPILVAVSAPTALAVRTAETAGLTLVAVARGADFEIFTRPERIAGAAPKGITA